MEYVEGITLGKKMNWLEVAYQKGRIDYPYLSKYDPFFDNIRGEKRFKKLMDRIKYDWENIEVKGARSSQVEGSNE